MADRLTEREVQLFSLETQHNPAQVGAVDIFDTGPGGEPLDLRQLSALIQDRLSYVPRYRQRVLGVPGTVGLPVWVDDEDFDLSYHVRAAALPSPGSFEQLADFVARTCAERLDQTRPLWEVCLVEGISGGYRALVWKTHQLLVDERDAVDLGQVLLESAPADDIESIDGWFGREWWPEAEPGPVELLAGVAMDFAEGSGQLVPHLRRGATEFLGMILSAGESLGGGAAVVCEVIGGLVQGGRPPIDSPLGGASSRHRRWAASAIPLAQLVELRGRARDSCGADDPLRRVTIDDVVLAMITGALRSWLLGRDALPGRPLITLAPVSVQDQDKEPTALGSAVLPRLVTLGVDESRPREQLRQIARQTQDHLERERSVPAKELSQIAGFAPPSLHALGVRSALDSRRSPFDLMVTNVPGPQDAVYAGQAQLRTSIPVIALTAGHQIAIGATSYDGTIQIGITADRDGVPDLDELITAIPVALEDLAAAFPPVGPE